MNATNPFKFGSVVDGPYFTNRKEEINLVKRVIAGENHLILISPRRYGKTSLVFKVTSTLQRPVIALDLQIITSTSDLSAQLLKRIYRVYPFEKVRQYVRHFRVIPTITINPVSNAVEVSFQAGTAPLPVLEDTMNLVDKLGSKGRKPVVVFDEFQEARRIDPQLLSQMRSVMQHHKHVNYVFLGSHESAIKEIFEAKQSPFYHFGMVHVLGKIPRKDFLAYLSKGFRQVSSQPEKLSDRILEITKNHPYHTQKIAWMTWEACLKEPKATHPEQQAIASLLTIHDADHERLWNQLNKTDQKLIFGLCESGKNPLSDHFITTHSLGATSTVYSSLKRLMAQGIIVKHQSEYEIDDPVFSAWIQQRRTT
jgi:uncharacterized protein